MNLQDLSSAEFDALWAKNFDDLDDDLRIEQRRRARALLAGFTGQVKKCPSGKPMKAGGKHSGRYEVQHTTETAKLAWGS